jgi:hypothetical protein
MSPDIENNAAWLAKRPQRRKLRRVIDIPSAPPLLRTLVGNPEIELLATTVDRLNERQVFVRTAFEFKTELLQALPYELC